MSKVRVEVDGKVLVDCDLHDVEGAVRVLAPSYPVGPETEKKWVEMARDNKSYPVEDEDDYPWEEIVLDGKVVMEVYPCKIVLGHDGKFWGLSDWGIDLQLVSLEDVLALCRYLLVD